MGNFNLEDYEPVQSRIKKFYEKYPDGRILSELMSPVGQLETVVFQSRVFNGEVMLANGWAFEKFGQGFVNKTCHLENCETSAIGRALANIGLDGDKRPSREEMEKVERYEAEPGAFNDVKQDDFL